MNEVIDGAWYRPARQFEVDAGASCLYCGAFLPIVGRPDGVPENEEEWEIEAQYHQGSCEWVATHAHRRELAS